MSENPLTPLSEEPAEALSNEQSDAPDMSDAEVLTPSTSQAEQEIAAQEFYRRFQKLDRIEHWVFITSFLTLGLTGLVQRYAESPISQWIINALGGIEMTRQIHHIAAILMMLSVIYHIGAIGYKIYVRRVRLTMLPAPYDFLAAWDTLKYFIGTRKHPAQQGRFTFEEKVEYWAVVWGTFVMGSDRFHDVESDYDHQAGGWTVYPGSQIRSQYGSGACSAFDIHLALLPYLCKNFEQKYVQWQIE